MIISNSLFNNSIGKINKQQNNNPKVSFGAVYLENSVDLGSCAEKGYPAQFLKKDALLINEIAQQFPNQDCFIRRGHGGHPKLEFREKPPVVQGFTSGVFGEYKTRIDSNDENYPCIPLILKDGSPLNQIIGLPSYISNNPSLPTTIKAGFELHKKLLAARDEILTQIGATDEINLGGDIMKRAYEEIKEDEDAVTRYLLETALLTLSDKPTAETIYQSDLPKGQQILSERRRLDLVTSIGKREIPKENKEIDICEKAKTYCNTRNAEAEEKRKLRGEQKVKKSNAEIVDELTKFMLTNDLTLK